ncbi:MAG: hypothetical protein ABH821_02490 [archaeon]
MKLGKIIIAAIVFLLIALIVHSAGAMAGMNYYLEPEYFPVWSQIMMPNAEPPGTEFYALSMLFNFIAGLIFAGFYVFVKNLFKDKSKLLQGAKFGGLLFVLITIPSTLSMILLINLPLTLIVLWAVESLVIFKLSGIAFVKLLK